MAIDAAARAVAAAADDADTPEPSPYPDPKPNASPYPTERQPSFELPVPDRALVPRQVISDIDKMIAILRQEEADDIDKTPGARTR